MTCFPDEPGWRYPLPFAIGLANVLSPGVLSIHPARPGGRILTMPRSGVGPLAATHDLHQRAPSDGCLGRRC